MNDFRQNADIRGLAANRRAEAAYDLLVAIVIGVGLAAALVAWWTA